MPTPRLRWDGRPSWTSGRNVTTFYESRLVRGAISACSAPSRVATTERKSDVDLLVDMAPDRSLLDVEGLAQDLEELLDRKVNVLTSRLHSAVRHRILASRDRREGRARLARSHSRRNQRHRSTHWRAPTRSSPSGGARMRLFANSRSVGIYSAVSISAELNEAGDRVAVGAAEILARLGLIPSRGSASLGGIA
jgi:hypothetical protein